MTDMEILAEYALSAAHAVYASAGGAACGADSAADAAQDALVALLESRGRGAEISDERAWLASVVRRRFYDSLRKKYRLPTVSFDEIPRPPRRAEHSDSADAEDARRAVALLEARWREIIVARYFRDESVADIARRLGIPEGTVKSRLSAGREKTREVLFMESNLRQDIEPKRLWLSNSGSSGLAFEPMSVVNGDALAENALIAAYDEPKTVTEIASALGVAAGYVEPVIEKLVRNELMARAGNRFYTDFIIFRTGDQEKALRIADEYASAHFDSLWGALASGLDSLRGEDYYLRCGARQRLCLEHFFSLDALETAYVAMTERADPSSRICEFPDRPNGGKWIAFGYERAAGERPSELMTSHSYSGMRNAERDDFLGAKKLRLSEFDDEFAGGSYYRDLPYDMFTPELARLLYTVLTHEPPSAAGLDLHQLENVAPLTARGVFERGEDGLRVGLPVLGDGEFARMDALADKTALRAADSAFDDASGAETYLSCLSRARVRPPKHLASVPKMKQYMPFAAGIPLAVLLEADSRGLTAFTRERNAHPCVLSVLE